MVNQRVSSKLLFKSVRTLIIGAANREAEERVRVKMLLQEAPGPILRQVDA
jgi:hypothetical protein